MIGHCIQAYPKEGCGLLIGTKGTDLWIVQRCLPLPNVKGEENQRYEFEIDPRHYVRADREARSDGLEIIGTFHSHPDVPAYPSTTDLQFAWTNFLTLIVAVFDGKKIRSRAHIFDGNSFSELPLYTLLSPNQRPDPTLVSQPQHTLNLVGEVEPFITISVLDQINKLPPRSLLSVRFTYEPTRQHLPDRLTSEGHTILSFLWSERGYYELILRTRSVR